MAENFYTILTAVGKAKIANAYTLGTTVNLTHLAVGDGNGSYYNPTESQTALRNELWRGVINSITVDGQNPNWIVIEAVIPTSDGGFMIREVGVFDDAGDLVAIGKYPETYKPVPTEGSAKDLYIRMILEVSNASSVTLKIDPAVILATKKQVDEAESRAKAYTDAHANTPAPHSGHALASDLAAHLADNTKHVTKDGVLQNGLNADMLDGVHLDSLPLLGTNNQIVNLFKALNQRVDTRSVSLTYDTNGRLTTVTEADGATTVKTTTLTYDASGNFTTVIEQVGGKTITTTLTYTSGNLTSVTRSVT